MPSSNKPSKEPKIILENEEIIKGMLDVERQRLAVEKIREENISKELDATQKSSHDSSELVKLDL